MMKLSVSAWDLQANSVEINCLNCLFWSHHIILMDLMLVLLLTDLGYALYLYLYRKA
jgi:hypothetical protein